MGHTEEQTGPYRLDPEVGHNESQDQLVVKPLKTWKGYIWDTWELPKDQRWLLFKLDAFVLTFASVGSEIPLLGKKKAF
jgi:ACS family pantothenate transporter-like MFS transporter